MNYHPDSSEPNVQGMERTASIAGGFLLLGWGMRTGGLAGLLEMALGGVALARGFTGQCAAKRALCRACSTGQCEEHSRFDRNSEIPDRGPSVSTTATSTGSPQTSTPPSPSGSPSSYP